MHMAGSGGTYLAALVCLYSLFEFLLKRLLWDPSGSTRHAPATQASSLFAILAIGTSGFFSVTLIVGYGVIAAAYWLYESVGREQSEARLLERFLLKQGVMMTLLYVLWRAALPVTVHSWYASAEGFILGGMADTSRRNAPLILATLASYMFAVDGGTQVVKGILGKFPGLQKNVIDALRESRGRKSTPEVNEENVGEWIGILERIITLTLVLTGNFTAIAFVLTAKSIARFKALEESKDFAEYYLLGTSGSMIVALGTGMIVRVMFGL